MYQLITSKGRKSSDNLADLAAWIEEMQPSSVRIVWGDVEAEVDCSDDAETVADELRRALRMEEAGRLDLTISNDNIYLAGFGGKHGDLVFLRFDVGSVTLIDNRNEVARQIGDAETMASIVAAVAAEG